MFRAVLLLVAFFAVTFAAVNPPKIPSELAPPNGTLYATQYYIGTRYYLSNGTVASVVAVNGYLYKLVSRSKKDYKNRAAVAQSSYIYSSISDVSTTTIAQFQYLSDRSWFTSTGGNLKFIAGKKRKDLVQALNQISTSSSTGYYANTTYYVRYKVTGGAAPSKPGKAGVITPVDFYGYVALFR
eukprot:TRINITY_DN10514_c0_g1_i1.p1 TRINITY_DN10514_c0_g1~~TRINITY_DN10514_c0_g1_i1.p1  ORF type:complete len:184 (+),score=24.38 TRINITY_DN10514_c0_g1_i1:90-641(+)